MKRKTRGIIFLIIGLILLIININSFLSKDNLEMKKDLITIQNEIEFKSKGYTIEEPNIILNPYGNSPLTALIIFNTTEQVEPILTIKGKDELTTFSNKFEKNKTHYIPIYGLYPGIENEITIEYKDVKKSIMIKTEQLPKDFILPESVFTKKEKLTNDLYFFSPSAKGYTCAYDVNGDVRWYLTINAVWEINRLENGNLLLSTDKFINPPYYMTGLYEMDLLGKIYNEYSLPGGYHHDYFEMENGNLLIATDDFINDTVEDIIVEINRKTGNIVKKYDLKKILNQTDGKSENWIPYDWFHNNSVWYDKKTNSITLSGRHQDAVINIDYKTGELNWIIGDSTNWSEEYQKYFFTPTNDLEWQWSQHAAMITPEGYVFILDNGNNKSKIMKEYISAENSYTRGVMYEINTKKMTIKQIWQYGKERGSEFYSPYISDVDYLDKNHYIIHSGGISYKDGIIQNQPAGMVQADKLVSDTVEILNDEIIFEISLPTNNYRVEKIPLYVNNKTHKVIEGKKLGTLGITKRNKAEIFLKKPKQTIDINITKEEDRLVIQHQYKKDDEVYIILNNGFFSKKYKINVSKKPYTALCVDIYTEEENENGLVVTQYINKENLYGKYRIYVEINKEIFDTKKTIKFNEF